MKKALWLPLTMLLLLTLIPTTAKAELCERCKGMMMITSIGKCVECGKPTRSGALRLCPECSKRLNKCEACQRSLSIANRTGDDMVAVTKTQRSVAPMANKLAQGNTAFALNLYRQIAKPAAGETPKNIFFSPYSISSALAMTAVGASGETAKQMQEVLGLPVEQVVERKGLRVIQMENQTVAPEVYGAGFRALNKSLRDDAGANYELSIANALWVQQGMTLQPPFVEINRHYFDSGLKELDFVKDSNGSRTEINDWVEEETQDKIKDLLAPGSLNPQTALVLTNAIYFKADWLQKFSTDSTRPTPFKTLNREEGVEAPLAAMMNKKARFRMLETKDAEVLELPYKGNRLVMLILLPREEGVEALRALENSLTPALLEKWETVMSDREVKVFIPKFKITWGAVNLNNPLKALGMQDAFLSGKADFSGINGARDLWIDKVVHKAFIDVNETGTEAAAATAVLITKSGSPTFRADHPFLFLIRDKQTNSILFMGRVMDPGSGTSATTTAWLGRTAVAALIVVFTLLALFFVLKYRLFARKPKKANEWPEPAPFMDNTIDPAGE